MDFTSCTVAAFEVGIGVESGHAVSTLTSDTTSC